MNYNKKKQVNLTDVVWFQEGPGVRNTQYTKQGVKLLNVANLVNGKIDLSTSSRYISENEAYGKYRHFLVDEGDLILASSGIQVDYLHKKMGFIQKEHLPLCMNTSTIRFKSLDDNVLNIRFFMYFLKSNCFKDQVARQITGSAQLNFGPSHLKRMKIVVPPIDEQNAICSLLDKLNLVIEKKKEQVAELDNLAQSLFYDMFGDPIANEKGWTVKTLGDIAYIGLGFTHTPKYVETGIPFLSVKDISSGKIVWDNIRYISEKEYLSAPKGAKPSNGDIMFCRVGTMGKPVIINTEKPFCTFVSLGYLHILDCNVINTYIKYWMESYAFDVQVEANVKGLAIKNLNTGWLKTFKIQIPPLPLQQAFAEKVKAIERQKELINQSIKDVQTLFDAKMDYYFGD